MAIQIIVTPEAKHFDGTAEGVVQLQVESDQNETSVLNLYVKANIISTPSRRQRILWDQYHNLRYPSGYFPRDNLKLKNDPLDWNADHVNNRF